MDFQEMQSFFNSKDFLARNLGMRIVALEKGYAKAVLEVKEEHKNGIGIVHGGALFSLADFAFAAASNSHGWSAVAINASIAYHKAVEQGTLTALAKELSLNFKLASYEVSIFDQSEELCASFQGTVYRSKKQLEIEKQ
mgnify:CR=1 FL=1